MAKFSVASVTQMEMGLLLVLICWTTCSNGAAFSSEEEFRQLKENYIQMKEVVKSLEAKVSQLKSLETKVQEQDSLLNSLLRERNERTAENGFHSSPISTKQSAVAINGLPSSCRDLKMIGHIWSGIYSVMGNSMMESVYCDFTKLPDDAGFQKWIGYDDVQSAPVHFYLQRNSTYSAQYNSIKFDLALVNEGNAMNLTTGIFTAPRQGTYFFSFTGVAYVYGTSSSSSFFCSLYLNGNRIVVSSVREFNGPTDQFSPLTLQSTLNLKKGDQVKVDISYDGSYSFLHESSDHYTHFTGFMLKEEIVASL